MIFTMIIKTWYFKNSNLILIVHMFRILFDLPKSSIWNKDLLLHVNPNKILKNVHTKTSTPSEVIKLKNLDEINSILLNFYLDENEPLDNIF